MDLIKIILQEHSKRQKDLIVRYINNNSAHFAELMTIFLNGPYRITQRASWPLSYCIEKNPSLIKPHFATLLRTLHRTDTHDAVKRNILRALQFVSIPKVHQGITVTLCMRYLTDGKEPVAIRVFAMTVLSNLAKANPDLKNELIPIIEDHLLFGSAGFVSRGNKILKELSQINDKKI